MILPGWNQLFVIQVSCNAHVVAPSSNEVGHNFASVPGTAVADVMTVQGKSFFQLFAHRMYCQSNPMQQIPILLRWVGGILEGYAVFERNLASLLFTGFQVWAWCSLQSTVFAEKIGIRIKVFVVFCCKSD